MELLLALLLLILVAVNYFLHRDILYPGFLQAALWLGAVAVFVGNRTAFTPVAESVFLIFGLGTLLFSMGAFVATHDHRPVRYRNFVREQTLPGNWIVWALAFVLLVGLVAYVARVRELIASGPTNNPFINLRYAVSVNQETTGGFGVVAYFVPLANAFIAIVLLKRRGPATPATSWLCSAYAITLGIIFGVLSSGRGPILFALLIIFTVPAVLRAIHPVRWGLAMGAIMLGIFVIVGIVLGKGGNLQSTFVENIGTLRESILTYAVGSFPALDIFLANQSPELDLGLNTFRSAFAVLNRAGIEATVVPLTQQFVDVPMPHNVYTIYQPYIKDFGVLAGCSTLFLLGLLHGLIYRRATVARPHAAAVVAFAFSMFPLVMQVFQDSYFSLLSTWAQVIIYLVVFLVVLTPRVLNPPKDASV